jgi:hypothetical protein
MEEGILSNFKKLLFEKPEENLAENFEKILLNLRFEGCSKQYLQKLINICHNHNFSTAIIHLSLFCFGEQGPVHALSELKNFYLDVVARKSENKDVFQPSLD